ncbi:MAG: magnesium chelatase subunit D [Pseudomonadota bacterium]|nr:magnesium chelatase subunit D [Pseudomonadota bacterium]
MPTENHPENSIFDDAQDQISIAILAVSLLAIDHQNLTGIDFIARANSIREKVFKNIAALFGEMDFMKIHPSVTDTQLLGGLDFSGTIELGKPVYLKGYLQSTNKLFFLAMAERFDRGLIARFTEQIDTNQNHCFLASNEGTEDESLATALSERLAFQISLEGLRSKDWGKVRFNARKIKSAKTKVKRIRITENIINTYVMLAAELGITSIRAPLMACYAARAAAALRGSMEIDQSDVLNGAKLVLAHRSTILPETQDEREQDEEPDFPSDNKESEDRKSELEGIVSKEILLDAVLSALPKDIIKNLTKNEMARNQGSSGSGSGQKKLSNRRGRPLRSQPGSLNSRNRLDIVETLRAAAPWQKIRINRSRFPNSNIKIRSSDIRIKRNEERSDRLIVFTVDASGTSAFGRLGETKGAIEILLSEAYARRDQVALISFKGNSAKIELPPTRSLVQTKKRLAALPGGGGTPLASGLEEAYNLAMKSRNRGITPTLAILTDGKGNIARDGSPGRDIAKRDTENLSKVIRASLIPSIVIDISTRPQREALELANGLGAKYIALPKADSKRLSSAVTEAME